MLRETARITSASRSAMLFATRAITPLGLLLGVALGGCAAPARSLPTSSLVARAWEGREPPPTPQSWAVVQFAWARVGLPYCWGGTGPSCFDCSGLVQQAWRSVGVRVPRTSSDIAREVPEVRLEDIRAGDILWWPGHVGIYAGSGWVVDALDHRHGIVRRPAMTPYRAFRPFTAESADPVAFRGR